MNEQPDSLRELARKTAKSIVDHGSVPMATLKESIMLKDKVDELLAKEIEFPEVEPFPEIPEVDLTPIESKLDEILVETKKKDYLEYDLQIDEETRAKLKGDKGDSYILTAKDKKEIANSIEVPVYEKKIITNEVVEVAVPDTPEEIVAKLESLKDEERLDISAIKGVDEFVQDKVERIKTSKGGGLSRATADTLYTPLGSGLESSFETVSANLPSSDSTLNYNGSGDITSIVYSNGVTKTFNYTGTDITSIVLSGSTPSGISLTKTLTYSSGDVTGIAYT